MWEENGQKNSPSPKYKNWTWKICPKYCIQKDQKIVCQKKKLYVKGKKLYVKRKNVCKKKKIVPGWGKLGLKCDPVGNWVPGPLVPGWAKSWLEHCMRDGFGFGVGFGDRFRVGFGLGVCGFVWALICIWPAYFFGFQGVQRILEYSDTSIRLR